MKTITITATSTEETVQQIQKVIGGVIKERWGEYVLEVANTIANGSIRFITFEWGGSLLEYNITFFEEITLIMDASEYNPIHFTYVSEGYCFHKFEKEDAKRKLDTLQPVIITSKSGGFNYGYFPKDEKIYITVIQISRIEFINSRLNDASILNKKLYEVFYDTNHENTFAYYGTYNLKLAQLVKQLNKVKQKGMMRILLIEGIVYQILALEMAHYAKDMQAIKEKAPMSKLELNSVRKASNIILKDVAADYNVADLALEVGLTQAKLQEGFKYLFSRTVIEYIRHIRLQKARDLMNTTELNISQIIYTIGFSSRSYFSKIFKNKFGITPSNFLKNKQNVSISVH